MKKLVLTLIIFVVAFSQVKSQETTASIEYSDLFNQKFTGELAYETTSFVEKYWRVPGNTGFNKTIYKVAKQLENDGYVLEKNSTAKDHLTYRIETRHLDSPTWEPVDATVSIIGQKEPLLVYATNRNMIALNSFSTPKNGVTAEVIYIRDLKKLKTTNVKGKIVFAESSPRSLYEATINNGGAVGIITYDNPKYLQPEVNVTSIQFRTIPLDTLHKAWGIALSFEAKEHLLAALAKGKVSLNVDIQTKIYESKELTIIADVKGCELPRERLVFSAHVQEPGANDNATGVGLALEMASVTAKLIKEGKISPKRSLTFLWGDEIRSTKRYVQDDSLRGKNIKWGISLDMVGENTSLTGGTFLIEKMPDPSAIWTRGNDKHTDWGGIKLKLEDMRPHYLNDFVIDIFKAQGKRTNWVVETNPFEGGSDHVPFLREGIPSVLFWHFTDQFYHTDNDRIDKVSISTLKNVGVASLVSALELINSNENTAKQVILTIEKAAILRLEEELIQSELAIENGESIKTQIEIINAWEDWYVQAISTTVDMVSDIELLNSQLELSKKAIKAIAKTSRKFLRND